MIDKLLRYKKTKNK